MSDVIEDPESFIDKAVETASQITTGGLAKYTPSTGKVDKGYTTRNIDETIGEWTGRNLQREALAQQRATVQQATSEQIALRDQERQRRQQQELNTSNYTASIRERAVARANRRLGSSSTDFLGS